MAISFGDQGRIVYAKVWSVEDKGKYVKTQISTSRKDKEGNYINSGWFANFVGKSVDMAKQINEKDSIQILAGQIENKKNEDGKYFTSLTIFEFQFSDNNNSSSQQTSSRPVNSKRTQNLDVPPPIDEDEDMPF